MLITLEAWAQRMYGDSAPHPQTLRRWARQAKIFPIPRRHGRAYRVEETARYVGDYNDSGFVEGIRDASAA